MPPAPTSPSPSPSASQPVHTSPAPSTTDDLPSLLLQMQETIQQIHETVTALQPHSSSTTHAIASPEEHAKLTELESRRDSAIKSLLTAFSAESEYLSQKRRVEREEILERRRQEDEEVAKRRREEDVTWEEKLRLEDEEREKRLERERQEVERETEELMGEIERGWERRWEEEVGRLKGLEGRRKELNRLIEEKLQAHTEIPVALNAKAIRAARTISTDQPLVSEQTSHTEATEPNEAKESNKTKTTERGFLPAAAFESAPPDLDREYNPDPPTTKPQSEPLPRSLHVPANEPNLSTPLQETLTTMSMDDLLNEPDLDSLNCLPTRGISEPQVASCSRPTSPVGRTLSAVDDDDIEDQTTEDHTTEEQTASTSTSTVKDIPFESSANLEPPVSEYDDVDIRERELEVETTTTDGSTKTSPVDVEFQGLPIRPRAMGEGGGDLHLDEFAEVEEEEEETEKDGMEGEHEHCGLPVEHDVVVEDLGLVYGGRERERLDSLGIIHPVAALPAPAPDMPQGSDGERGGAEAAPAPAQPQREPSSPDSESSDYTPYSQPTPPSSANRQLTHNAPNSTSTSTSTTDTAHEGSTNPNPNPEPQQAPAPHRTSMMADQEDIDTVPSDADAHSISTASERGSYSDINEPEPEPEPDPATTSPRSPTAAKAEEEDERDADFVPGQDEEVQIRELRVLEKVGGGEREGDGLGGKGEGAVVPGEEVPGEEVLKGLTGADHEPVDVVVERERGIEEAEPQLEDHHEQDQVQVQELDHVPEPEQEQAIDAEAVDKEVLEQEVLEGLVDHPVGPAHDGVFELEEEAMRARGVLEPHTSAVDLAEGNDNDNADSPVMGVNGVVEPPVSPAPEPEQQPEHEPEPEPVPVEELAREQEEMGLGRPGPHPEHDEGHPSVNILDMDRHPLDHEHVSHAVGVALTHSEPVHMRHTPVEEGDEPAHYFVDEHHVPHSTDAYYTPAEVPLRDSYYDQHGHLPEQHVDESYVAHGDHHVHEHDANDHRFDDAHNHAQEEAEEDTQPRYHLYERPYTPSDFAPTPMESSFHHIEHAGHQGQGQPQVVVVTPEPAAHHELNEPADRDVGGEGSGLVDDDADSDGEIGYSLERVPSHQDVEEADESPGPSVDDFPMPGDTTNASSGAVHGQDHGLEPRVEHYIGHDHEDEDDQGHEVDSSESESEDFEGRGGMTVHHLDAIAEEEGECEEEVEAEVGDGVERRDMAAEAEAKEGAAASDEDEVRSIPADQSNVTLPDEAVQADPEIEAAAEAEAEELAEANHETHEQDDTVESAPADLQTYDETYRPALARQQTDATEATEDSDADEDSAEPSEPERIHEEDPDPRLSEEQPALDEAPEIKVATEQEQEHKPHESHLDDVQTQYQPGPEDDEYDPFRYSPPKKTEGQHESQSDFERSSDQVLNLNVMSKPEAARSERSLAEELEDAGSDTDDDHEQEEEPADEQVPLEVVADIHAGHDYSSTDEDSNTLADEEANRAYDHSPHPFHHNEAPEAQQPQHLDAPVLQLIEPSDTENGFASEASSVSGHPHAVTREDVGRDWSEVDQFLSESESEDEAGEVEHVEEVAPAALETPAHEKPNEELDIDAAVEAALETPANEIEASPAADTVEPHEPYDERDMHHSPELAQGQFADAEPTTHEEHPDQNRPSTPDQPQHPEADDNNTVNPANHHDLPPLTIPATPPSPAHEAVSHAHDEDHGHEVEEEFIPRDVTNRPWRSDTVATADTSATLPTISSPQSARSGTTLSSGPSSPIPESDTAPGAQDPRIRDSTGANIGRPRGLTEGTDYSGGGYGSSYNDRSYDREPVPKGQKVMELWHERERSLSRTEEVRLSGDSTRSSEHNRGSGSGSGGGSSLFQRMRSVFEQSSSPAAAANNRVSMPSFFTKSHGSSPSQSSSFLDSAAKQRPMSTSPYGAPRHRNDGYHQVQEADEAEEAGENAGLLHQQDEDDHHQQYHDNPQAAYRDQEGETSDDGYDSEYERERERRRQERRERRRHEREKEEWRERHGMILPEPVVLTEPVFGKMEGEEDMEGGKGRMGEVFLGKEERLVELGKNVKPLSGDMQGVEVKVERWQRSQEEVVGRWWIDKRLRWNGEPPSPRKTKPVVLSLEPPLPPVPPSPRDVVEIWRQGVRCPPLVISSSAIMNRARGSHVLPEPLASDAASSTTVELGVASLDTGLVPPTTSISSFGATSAGTSKVSCCTYTTAVGDAHLPWTFIQGWLTRLRTAQSFINRARMERQFDDVTGYNFEPIPLSPLKLDWTVLEEQMGVDRYMYRRTSEEYRRSGRTWADVVRGEKREEEQERERRRGWGLLWVGVGGNIYCRSVWSLYRVRYS
ncbi:hypothetical protein B0T20DRAFT_434113 [Sordaria brevicollis]|uniref:Uncharacterized protein n=1 Tax=Sordaria brevicollis TaxID=83679 RepID=A0AAE0PGY1_SORBR|nr:hypothetical protein B0T20DRAFT_434113 [Sordaria brevicollis]